jgi:hypothetical protein
LGTMAEAECLDCKGQFSVSEGGGFAFHLLRCEQCGEETSVGFDELGDLHVRYLKGSERPYTVVHAEQHRHVRDHVDVEPLSSEEYFAAVEVAAGQCDCGGKLSFDAPARCPECRSTRYRESGPPICYD